MNLDEAQARSLEAALAREREWLVVEVFERAQVGFPDALPLGKRHQRRQRSTGQHVVVD
jgi:hypothetical protein